MNFESSCRWGFTTICILCTLSMVGYWFYKFAEEDRDIGVVDYESFETISENPFPVVTFCFYDIFLPRKFADISPDMDITEYVEYLNGEVYDKAYERIDYWNVTMSLEDYFLYGIVNWSNETGWRSDTLTFQHTVNFNGLYYDGPFRKCFEISSDINLHRYVKEIWLFYNLTAFFAELESDYPVELFFNIHYPGQFLLATNDPDWISMKGGGESHEVYIEDVEHLKSRNSQKRTCTLKSEIESYDDMVANEHVIQNGCRPPYIRAYKDYPLCNTTEKLERAIYSYNVIRKKYLPVACERISKVYYYYDDPNKLESNETWGFSITYPDYVRIIKQSKEVDIHALIGNIGGYVGFFLGTIKLSMLTIHHLYLDDKVGYL